MQMMTRKFNPRRDSDEQTIPSRENFSYGKTASLAQNAKENPCKLISLEIFITTCMQLKRGWQNMMVFSVAF